MARCYILSGCGSRSIRALQVPSRARPFPVARPGQRIFGKGARESFLAADLLAADERVDRHGNGAIDVLGRDVVGKTHAAESFADTHDGFKMTDLERC